MVSGDAVKWARQRMEKGIEEEEIRRVLEKTKYSGEADEIIKEAQRGGEGKPAATPVEEKPVKEKAKKKEKAGKKEEIVNFLATNKIFLVLLVLFLLAVGGIVYSAFKESEQQELAVSDIKGLMVRELFLLKDSDQTVSHVGAEFFAGDVVESVSVASIAEIGQVQFCAQGVVFPRYCEAELSDVCPEGFFFDGEPARQYFDQQEKRTHEGVVTALEKVRGDLRASKYCGTYFIGFKAIEASE